MIGVALAVAMEHFQEPTKSAVDGIDRLAWAAN